MYGTSERERKETAERERNARGRGSGADVGELGWRRGMDGIR